MLTAVKSSCEFESIARCAPGQPGGLPEISRGLSAAKPPVAVRKTSRTLEGCHNRSPFPSRNHRRESLAPLRGAFPFRSPSGGIVALRAPQPPANFYETSGLETAHREHRIAAKIESGFRRQHELTSVTKSFGAVRALKGVSFDLRAGQPGGLPDISRGLSQRHPRNAVRKTSRTPEGCQNRSAFPSRNHRRESLAPLRGALPFRPLSGGVASRCSAQPPANFCETSGLGFPRYIQTTNCT